MNENKANPDDPRIQRARFLKDNPSKHFAHGTYSGGDDKDTDYFHDNLVAKHGGTSDSHGGFAIPHKSVDTFHQAAKKAGYEHGKHYHGLLSSQHTEEPEKVEAEQYAENGAPIRNKPIKKRTYLDQLKAGAKPPYGHSFGRC